MTRAELCALDEFLRPLHSQIAVGRRHLEQINKQLERESAHLLHTRFCERAPVEVVNKARDQLHQLRKEQTVLAARLKALESESLSAKPLV